MEWIEEHDIFQKVAGQIVYRATVGSPYYSAYYIRDLRRWLF